MPTRIKDGSLATTWSGTFRSYESTVHMSWSDPATIHRIVIWDALANQNEIAIAFSDGTLITDISMDRLGRQCADISFPAKTVQWIQVIPFEYGSMTVGYEEIDVWATVGEQWSNNTCSNPTQRVATPGIVSPPPEVAPQRPGRVPPVIAHLIVSLDPDRSSDGKAHGPGDPYLIPLDARYQTVLIEEGAFASSRAWDGGAGGIVRFSATGEVRIEGTLTVAGRGYRGGPTFVGADGGRQGESHPGLGGQFVAANGGGGGGGNGADGGAAAADTAPRALSAPTRPLSRLRPEAWHTATRRSRHCGAAQAVDHQERSRSGSAGPVARVVARSASRPTPSS